MPRKKLSAKTSAATSNKKKLFNAIKKDIEKVLLKHKLLAKPVVVWQNDKVVLIAAPIKKSKRES